MMKVLFLMNVVAFMAARSLVTVKVCGWLRPQVQSIVKKCKMTVNHSIKSDLKLLEPEENPQRLIEGVRYLVVLPP